MRWFVIEDYTPEYTEPIRGGAGQMVQGLRGDHEYPDWLWCRAAHGREGWVPEVYIRITGQEGTLRHDYSAQELHARAGAELHVLEELGGWARARDSEGRTGW